MESYTIFNFMTKNLKLSGDRLIIYAVIYEYSARHGGCYCGGNSKLSSLIGKTQKETENILNDMKSDNLIKCIGISYLGTEMLIVALEE